MEEKLLKELERLLDLNDRRSSDLFYDATWDRTRELIEEAKTKQPLDKEVLYGACHVRFNKDKMYRSPTNDQPALDYIFGIKHSTIEGAEKMALDREGIVKVTVELLKVK